MLKQVVGDISYYDERGREIFVNGKCWKKGEKYTFGTQTRFAG